jgi:predicted lipoprotein with Yx(FWY)xxD motif
MHPARPRSIATHRTARLLVPAAMLVATLAAMVATSHASTSSARAQVKVSQTKLGRIIVNAQGRTLYMFAADKHGKSACYGTCATFWPPLLTSTTHIAATGLKASLLGTTKRTGGKLQITYNGHPLYLFLKDTKPGQTTGQGLNASGGLWWVLSPAGAAITRTAAPATTTPATTTTTTTTTTIGGYGSGIVP